MGALHVTNPLLQTFQKLKNDFGLTTKSYATTTSDESNRTN